MHHHIFEMVVDKMDIMDDLDLLDRKNMRLEIQSWEILDLPKGVWKPETPLGMNPENCFIKA